VSSILSTLRSRRDARLRGDESGFSLIELTIVLLIIAILLAVAIPTYLSARDRAENRAAQETLEHAFTAAQAYYSSSGAFPYPSIGPSVAKTLNAEGSGPLFDPRGQGDANVFYVNQVSDTHGTQSIAFADWTPNFQCWYLMDIESPASKAITTSGVAGPGVYYGTGPAPHPTLSAPHGFGCTASFDAPPSGWKRSFAAAAQAAT